ncbi:CHASE domain-containing protein, partial [Ectothiorhodospira lacustris]|uniref:CHASE domain-containing protein n=1 Tax=Ectothiorhodospira lacustris TaxID=2899127 RepID=UPI001EE7FD83
MDWFSQRRGVALSLGLVGGALIILVLALSLWQANIATHTLQERLLNQVTQLAAALGWEDAEAMARGNLRQRTPVLDGITRQLKSFAALHSHLRIVTIIPREGMFLYGPESHAPPDAGRQGEPYKGSSDDLQTIINTGQALFTDRHADEYGHYTRALAPILHPRTGEVLLIVSLEIPTDLRDRNLMRTWLPGLGVAGLLLLIFAVAIVRALRPVEQNQDHQEQGELAAIVVTTLIIGLLFTALGTLLARQITEQEQLRVFDRQASQYAQRLREVFQRASDDLHVLARFMEVHGADGRLDFIDYVRPLTERSPLQAYMWVPRVTPDTRLLTEAQARINGLPGFRLHEYNPVDGIRLVPEDSLRIHYPALYIEPPGKGWSTLGFDMGSHRSHRIALMRAVSTGRVIGTHPVSLLYLDSAQDERGSLIFKRVNHRTHQGGEADSDPQGVVAAAMLFQDALEKVIGMHDT